PVPLSIETDVEHASISIDGRAHVCVAPCVVDLAPGDHVLCVDADGRARETRSVRVESANARVRVETTAATPELAAEQWIERYAGSPAIDSSESVRLLATAVRAKRLAFVSA